MAKPTMQAGSLSNDLKRLALAYADTAKFCWSRAGALNYRYLHQAVRSTTGAAPGERMMNAVSAPFDLASSYAMDAASLPWQALQVAATSLNRAPNTEPDMYFVADHNGWFDLDKKEGAPVFMPVRVDDATQFKLIFSINKSDAQAVLAERGLPFTALDTGRDETALVIFGIQYRKGDLGTYNELGIALYVTPSARPCGTPGMYILELPVNSDFARAAGKIWGLPKTTQELTFEIDTDKAYFRFLRRNTGNVMLSFVLPRGGAKPRMSTAVPVEVYTMKGGTPHQFTMLETGSGQTNQTDGSGIAVSLADGADHVNDPLWKMLNRFDISTKAPIFYEWSEHVSIDIGAPRKSS